jgi:hypothetical protein
MDSDKLAENESRGGCGGDVGFLSFLFESLMGFFW